MTDTKCWFADDDAQAEVDTAALRSIRDTVLLRILAIVTDDRCSDHEM